MESLSARLKFALIFIVVYVILINLFIGWRNDHTLFISIVAFLLLIHRSTFKLAFILSAFILFWISYDFMRIYPNYLVNSVHVQDLYDLEVRYFGVWDGGKKIILSEWFTERTHPMLTVFAGISYLLWVPGPILYTLYLSKKDPSGMVKFSYAFLLTNFIGFIIYYLYPAAPPWYYINYGAGTDFTIPGSEALLAHFDSLVGIPVFNSIYSKNANVFAAVPSLHAAYPLLGLYYSIVYRHKSFIVFFSVLSFGIWFAAVYSQHHYLIDLLLGGVCAAVGILLMHWLSMTGFYGKFNQFFHRQIRNGQENKIPSA